MNHTRIAAQLKLVNGTEKIVIRPATPAGADPVICKSWDIGAPEYRYTTVPNPGADGIVYSDGFVGSRTVTFELAIMGGVNTEDGQTHDAYWYASRLATMTHPMANPILELVRADELNNGKTHTMTLRGSPWTLPYTARSAALLEMQLIFVCPLGLAETNPPISVSTVDIPGDDNTEYDWVFPAMFPKTFGLKGVTYPSLVINVGGDTAISPTIYIFGPVTNPEISADTDRFRFDGLTLDVGETVQIDMGNGTVRLGTGTPTTILDDLTVYSTVDWAVSTFWRWLPGQHTVIYHNTRGSITVEYRERRLTI